MIERPAAPLVAPPAWIHWCVDARQVIVVDRSCGKGYALSGLAVAVWNWFSLGYSRSRVVEMASVAESLSMAAAGELVASLVCDWMADGLLVEQPDFHL
jgi:hypothetical protein